MSNRAGLPKINHRLKPKHVRGIVSHSVLRVDDEHLALEGYDADGRRIYVKFTPSELVKLRDTLERTTQRDWFKDMWSTETGMEIPELTNRAEWVRNLLS